MFNKAPKAIILALSGCAEFNEAIELQDQYASSLSRSYSPKISLNKKYTPKVTRGIISTNFTAVLPEGVYTPIASSAGRNFYQAPYDFKYMENGKVKSRVGGIVQVAENDDSTYYVWFFPHQYTYYEVQPNGEWIYDVKSGISNIVTRPWIEADLKINK